MSCDELERNEIILNCVKSHARAFNMTMLEAIKRSVTGAELLGDTHTYEYKYLKELLNNHPK